MLELHQFVPSYDLPNASPFCMKVETLLRMAGLDYETQVVKDPSKLPKGKAPMIVDGDTSVADSSFIAKYLESKHGADFNAGLSDEQKATAHMVQVMLEERTYWALAYSRWMDEDNWEGVKDVYFGRIPMPMRMAVAKLAKKSMNRNLEGHEIYGLAISDIQTLGVVMGDKPFVMGDEPTLVDATVYALLANALVKGVDSPLKVEVQKNPAFKAYVDRMTDRYFSK